VALLVAAVLLWVKSAAPAPAASDFADFAAIKYYLRHALESGPALYALIPFRLVARPYLAPDAAAFLVAFIPAAVLMLLHYWWVVRADVAFEEASVELSRKFAERIAAVRASGGWHSAAKPKKRKSPPFALRPTGVSAVAFLWKNLISAGHLFTLRTWIFLALFAVCAGVPIGLSSSSNGWLLPAVGILTVLLTGYSLFLGPAILRQDLRQDLANADILKMYPLRGWQVVLGELLAPAAILTGVQWCLVLLATATFSRFPEDNPIPLSTRLSLGGAVAIIAPMLNLVSLVIPNASALLFPAWMQTGRQHVGGIEVMGQRLIFMLGSVLVFGFALVPAAVVFGLVFFFVELFLGVMVAVPFGAAVAAAALAAEAALAIWWMGRLFEKFDLSAELAG
jgi:ABC-2 type transport system permease protein